MRVQQANEQQKNVQLNKCYTIYFICYLMTNNIHTHGTGRVLSFDIFLLWCNKWNAMFLVPRCRIYAWLCLFMRVCLGIYDFLNRYAIELADRIATSQRKNQKKKNKSRPFISFW